MPDTPPSPDQVEFSSEVTEFLKVYSTVMAEIRANMARVADAATQVENLVKQYPDANEFSVQALHSDGVVETQGTLLTDAWIALQSVFEVIDGAPKDLLEDALFEEIDDGLYDKIDDQRLTGMLDLVTISRVELERMGFSSEDIENLNKMLSQKGYSIGMVS